MRLSIFQIMLGTLPVIVLIIPSCLTGSLLYMASLVTETGNPVFDWAGTLSTITASITAVVQFASMIVAAYYLEQASDRYASEIAAIEDDIEVKEADARDEHIRQCYQNVTQWNSMPVMPKLLISCSLFSITVSCYMVRMLKAIGVCCCRCHSPQFFRTFTIRFNFSMIFASSSTLSPTQ